MPPQLVLLRSSDSAGLSGPVARWYLRALVVTAAVTGLLLADGGPAAAHTGLQSSTPADGEVLDQAPEAIALTFTEEVRPQFSQVAVTGPDGAPVTTGAATFDGPGVTQPVSIDADGPHVVAYRVVGDDSHPVSGQFTFTVARAGAGASSGTGAAPGTGPAGSTAPGTAAPRTETAAGAPTTDEQGGGWWWLTLVAAAVLAAGSVALVRRRRADGG